MVVSIFIQITLPLRERPRQNENKYNRLFILVRRTEKNVPVTTKEFLRDKIRISTDTINRITDRVPLTETRARPSSS